MSINFEEMTDVEDTEKESIDLGVLRAKIENMLSIEGDISRLEEELKAKNAALRKLSEQEIPEMMERAGMKSFDRTDGSKVTITTDLYTSIPKVRQQEIFAALRERGGGDLIKNELTVTLDKGSDNMAAQLEAQAKEMGLEVERTEGIAPQTYKKWIKEQLKADKPIDLSFFGAHQVTRAKIVQ